jgi:hypothetical protein
MVLLVQEVLLARVVQEVRGLEVQQVPPAQQSSEVLCMQVEL